MSNTILMLVVTGAIVPFLAPFVLDALACVAIALMNTTRGKPTWVRGTVFKKMVWPSGHVEEFVSIKAVTFRTVTLTVEGSTFTLKKRQMLGMLCMV